MKNFKMLSKAEMRKVAGGFACSAGSCFDEATMQCVMGDCDTSTVGSCGVNIYDTHGVKTEHKRGITKNTAISEAAAWNASHQSWCTSDCNAHATWCCESC
jgi:hypothetical protein